jgi:hypothetical protein
MPEGSNAFWTTTLDDVRRRWLVREVAADLERLPSAANQGSRGQKNR